MTDVILVGHSMAGTVITAVAARARERLAYLVYLDASVPRDGENDLKRHTAAWQEWWARQPRMENFAVIPPSVAHPFVVSDTEDARKVNAHMTPHPLRCFTDRVHVRHPDAFMNRRTYIECTLPDGRKPRSPMAHGVRAEGGWRNREIAAVHDVIITDPGKVADELLAVAALVWMPV